MNEKRKDRGRNDPCPCGSGRKYKRCCLEKDEAAAREARAKTAAEAAEEAGRKADEPTVREDEAPRGGRPAPPQTTKRASKHPWKRTGGGGHPAQHKNMPRKVGDK